MLYLTLPNLNIGIKKNKYNAPEVLKACKGNERFNKDHRAVFNTSISEVFGPGFR
ncbi:hypothetical protein ACS2CQ_23485 [Bacillus cereus group sp. BceL295]|uniref:hypothetical protein n=1 Tax=Bacillus cereus group sp. BceL295 TaxID=3444990 RepID=UPI000AEF7D62